KIVQGQHVIARERDIQEVINYRKVIEFIGEESEERSQKITEELIRRLHQLTVAKILPEETTGVYRKTQVVIKSSVTGEIVFRPPSPLEVTYQMVDLLAFLQSP